LPFYELAAAVISREALRGEVAALKNDWIAVDAFLTHKIPIGTGGSEKAILGMNA
jgi:hypothetical protein